MAWENSAVASQVAVRATSDVRVEEWHVALALNTVLQYVKHTSYEVSAPTVFYLAAKREYRIWLGECAELRSLNRHRHILSRQRTVTQLIMML